SRPTVSPRATAREPTCRAIIECERLAIQSALMLRIHELMKLTALAGVLTLALLGSACSSAAKWVPPSGTLSSEWGSTVSQKSPWPEYPRPALERALWKNLNGPWEFAE